MEYSHNKKFGPILFYALLILSFMATHLYFGFKAPLRNYELSGVIILDLWLLIVALIDLKTLYIPLWLTGPIILGLLAWRFLDQNYYHEPLIGFGLSPFMAATGISFGFLISDMITHFGNWFVKYPQSWQGLIPVWLSIFLIVLNLLLPAYPVWLVPLIVCLARACLYWLYEKNLNFQKVFDWLIKKPWLAYGLILGLIIFSAFINIKQNEKTNLIAYTLCMSFLLEEIFLPIFYKLFKIKVEEDNNPSILGGGDAMLIAALGAYWGPIVIANCLQMSFVLAFLFAGTSRLINWLKQKLKNSNSNNILQEIAFAPFIALSAQIIVLVEILIKN